jgi:hypothetical protein
LAERERNVVELCLRGAIFEQIGWQLDMDPEAAGEFRPVPSVPALLPNAFGVRLTADDAICA